MVAVNAIHESFGFWIVYILLEVIETLSAIYAFKPSYLVITLRAAKSLLYSDSHDGYIHMDWKLLKETFPELNLQKVD